MSSPISFDPRAFDRYSTRVAVDATRDRLASHHAALRRADRILVVLFVAVVAAGAIVGVVLP